MHNNNAGCVSVEMSNSRKWINIFKRASPVLHIGNLLVNILARYSKVENAKFIYSRALLHRGVSVRKKSYNLFDARNFPWNSKMNWIEY